MAYQENNRVVPLICDRMSKLCVHKRYAEEEFRETGIPYKILHFKFTKEIDRNQIMEL